MVHRTGVRIHPTADVSDRAVVGAGTSIWNQAQVREGACIGQECILGKDVYVDSGVQVGDNVKIQNGSQLFHGVTVESGVFIGPGVILTNDKRPRAINPDGTLQSDADWQVGPIRIGYGASLGARVVVLPDVTVGRFAMVGAGAVVTRDVPNHALVIGSPARIVGYVCKCGVKLKHSEGGKYSCPACGSANQIENGEGER